MKPIRILIADDHAVVRAGLRLLLSRQYDMSVVGEAEDGVQALHMATELRPDVIVMDLAMPGGSGLSATRAILDVWPRARVLVLTMYDDTAHLKQLMRIGAAGYVLKAAADIELINAIRAVSSGGTYVDPALADADLVSRGSSRGGRSAPPSSVAPPLSEREEEVLRLVAFGYTSAEIGQRLCLSRRTVEAHRATIMDKIGAHSRSELVRFAREIGCLGEPKSGD